MRTCTHYFTKRADSPLCGSWSGCCSNEWASFITLREKGRNQNFPVWAQNKCQRETGTKLKSSKSSLINSSAYHYGINCIIINTNKDFFPGWWKLNPHNKKQPPLRSELNEWWSEERPKPAHFLPNVSVVMLQPAHVLCSHIHLHRVKQWL